MIAPVTSRQEQASVYCVRPRRFNVGNETINVATRALLRQAFGNTLNVVPIPAQVSEEEGSLSGLSARTVHEMNRHACGVVVGGGNLYENGQLDIDLQAVSALRPPLLLFSLSHGRIFDHRGRLQPRTDAMPAERILALHRRATRSTVRDHASLAQLHELGLQDVVMAGCPTLFLDELAPPTGTASRAGDAPTFLSIRDPSLMSVPPADQARLHREIRGLVDVMESRGFGPVQLLCHDKRDLELASSFGDLPFILPDDVHDYLAMLRAARLVVSFRLHAFVPCLSFGTPTISISYDERSASLASSIGLGAWDVPYVGESDLAGAVADRIDRLDELPRIVDDARPLWEALRRETADVMASFAEACERYTAPETLVE